MSVITKSAELTIPTGVWVFDKAHTTIGFVARHLMVTKVRGRFAGFDGSIEIAHELTDSKVEVFIQADSVTTGSPERDAHLKSPDFFDVESYPTLTFISNGVVRKGEGWVLSGDLTIKDITRPVELNVVYDGAPISPFGDTRVAFSAWTDLDREKWGLTWNVPLEAGGFLVSKTARIEIETELVKV